MWETNTGDCDVSRTLTADRIHVAEAPVPAPLVEAPAPALDAAVPAPAPAPAEKDEIYLTQSSSTPDGPIQLVG